jgi:hypothetical protein
VPSWTQVVGKSGVEEGVAVIKMCAERSVRFSVSLGVVLGSVDEG